MSLNKVVYTDKQTPIFAKNLNDIQDAIIELQNSGGGSLVIATDTEITEIIGDN